MVSQVNSIAVCPPKDQHHIERLFGVIFPIQLKNADRLLEIAQVVNEMIREGKERFFFMTHNLDDYKNEDTPFHAVVLNGYLSIAQSMIDSNLGNDIYSAVFNVLQCLAGYKYSNLASNEKMELCRMLLKVLEKNPDRLFKPFHGFGGPEQNLLHLAATRGNATVVSALVDAAEKHLEKVLVKDGYGRTALESAQEQFKYLGGCAPDLPYEEMQQAFDQMKRIKECIIDILQEVNSQAELAAQRKRYLAGVTIIVGEKLSVEGVPEIVADYMGDQFPF